VVLHSVEILTGIKFITWKKKVRGGCELPGADMQKPYAPEYGQGKTKIDLFREFLQKSPMSKLSILFQLKFPQCIRQFNSHSLDQSDLRSWSVRTNHTCFKKIAVEIFTIY
jgi:hypothetical protein